MQNNLLFPVVAGIVALVFAAAATISPQQNNVPQQDEAYSAQTQNAEDSLQSDAVPAVSVEEAIKHYSLEYCFSINQHYQMLQQGYDVSAKRERFIRSEMQGCKQAWAAYEKIYPPGTIRTAIAPHPGFR